MHTYSTYYIIYYILMHIIDHSAVLCNISMHRNLNKLSGVTYLYVYKFSFVHVSSAGRFFFTLPAIPVALS